MLYLKTSAKSNQFVKDSFVEIIKIVLKDRNRLSNSKIFETEEEITEHCKCCKGFSCHAPCRIFWRVFFIGLCIYGSAEFYNILMLREKSKDPKSKEKLDILKSAQNLSYILNPFDQEGFNTLRAVVNTHAI